MATATPALVRAALVASLAAAVALHLDSGVYEAIYKKVWPPSWESAPFLIGCCIFTLAIMVLSFRASSKSKAQQLAIEKKRKLIGELCGPLCNTILRRRCTPPPLYPAAADLVSALRRQLRNSAAQLSGTRTTTRRRGKRTRTRTGRTRTRRRRRRRTRSRPSRPSSSR